MNRRFCAEGKLSVFGIGVEADMMVVDDFK